MNTQVPEDAVRRAIELYDLEEPYTEQPEEVMDEVEQIFGMKEIQWPTQHYRRMMISQKMRVSLKTVLKSYGYRMFSFYGKNKKARLEISPKPGQMPPPLPEWLQIPYIVPVKGYSWQIVYDSCVNPITRSGDGLYDQPDRIPDTSSLMAMTSYLSRTDNSIRSPR
jgi:hypothetical protein